MTQTEIASKEFDLACENDSNSSALKYIEIALTL